MHTCLHECNTCFVYANQRVCIAYIRVCAHVVSMYMYVSTRVCVCAHMRASPFTVRREGRDNLACVVAPGPGVTWQGRQEG